MGTFVWVADASVPRLQCVHSCPYSWGRVIAFKLLKYKCLRWKCLLRYWVSWKNIFNSYSNEQLARATNQILGHGLFPTLKPETFSCLWNIFMSLKPRACYQHSGIDRSPRCLSWRLWFVRCRLLSGFCPVRNEIWENPNFLYTFYFLAFLTFYIHFIYLFILLLYCQPPS